jgi:hypothetical protein
MSLAALEMAVAPPCAKLGTSPTSARQRLVLSFDHFGVEIFFINF